MEAAIDTSRQAHSSQWSINGVSPWPGNHLACNLLELNLHQLCSCSKALACPKSLCPSPVHQGQFQPSVSSSCHCMSFVLAIQEITWLVCVTQTYITG